jgi:hypothetical protein
MGYERLGHLSLDLLVRHKLEGNSRAGLPFASFLSRRRKWNITGKAAEYTVEACLELSLFRTICLYFAPMVNFLLDS